MGALVIAIVVGIAGVALVFGIIALSAVAVTGMKVVNAAHNSRGWLVNQWSRKHGG